MEGRDQPERSPSERSEVRTQSRGALLPHLARVNAAARKAAHTQFTALAAPCRYRSARTRVPTAEAAASAGVDGITVADYEQNLASNLQALRARIHTDRYRAQPVRRVYIPKADGGQRPLGVPTLEDKIVQGAEVLNAIYEVDFMGFSYGFRPGRNPHQALSALRTAIMSQHVNWVLDADICSFYDSIDREWLLRMLEHRIADPRVLRLLAAFPCPSRAIHRSRGFRPQATSG
jgi:RNA-directed DNA polymerase